ncbi:MAG: transcription termination/antitermination protein NusG [Buchnera aphidicola (Periphyllus aceris)]|nr:transcription termination/antitermination protein NusG [Buchnera aphidicola (Periphyllus aceris)]
MQIYSGFEDKVVKSIKKHIKKKNLKKTFEKILVPSEEVIEIKKGKRKKSDHKFFPGYVLIKMIMNEYNWHLIKSIPKVIGFIGGTPENPFPIKKKEIKLIQKKLLKIGNKPRPKTMFEPGESVRVKNGPFSDFNGIVEEIDYDKNRLKVSVSIFGRSTPVELDFIHVEKNS